MAVCPKDGGPSLQMGISDARVRLHYKIPYADALSRRVHPKVTTAATQVSSDPFKARLYTAQQEDTVTKQVLQTSSQKPQGRSWRRQPLLRFCQLWPQLSIEDGVLCRKYSPGPSSDVITVPVVPGSCSKSFYISVTMIQLLAIKELKKH